MKFILNPGTYFLGDIFYGLSDLNLKSEDIHEGENTIDNKTFWVLKTPWMSGTYFDQYGKSYGFDVGNISCLLFSDLKTYGSYNDYKFTFDQCFEFSKDENNHITFGHLKLDFQSK